MQHKHTQKFSLDTSEWNYGLEEILQFAVNKEWLLTQWSKLTADFSSTVIDTRAWYDNISKWAQEKQEIY